MAKKSDNPELKASPKVSPLKPNFETDGSKNWTYNHRLVREGGQSDETLPVQALQFLGKTPKELQFNFNDVFPCKTKRIHSLNITVQIPDQETFNGTTKVSVTPGTATRFNVPVSIESATAASPTKSKNNDMLCYRNAVSASIVPESFLEWAKLLRVQQSSKSPAPPSEIESKNNLVYDAVFIGTDDEFLCKKEIRDLFAKNALTLDDSKLFEMPEISEDDQVTFDPVNAVPETARCSLM